MKKIILNLSAARKTKTLLFFILWLGFVPFLHAQQEKTITGIVKTGDGQPLPGVNILVKGTNAGAMTDFDGNFSLQVPKKGRTLTVSYIGFETKQIDINDKKKFDITLKENLESLDDVVIIGYGKKKKGDLIGAVSTIGSKNIEEMPITSVEQSLSGQASGVQLRQNGAPGGGPEVLIRGIASTGGNNAPLYVVDGIPLGNIDSQRDNYILNSIDPASIASVSVLKDASSKAIYGSRAANGVVLITTKSGKKGKPTITFGTSTGFQTIPDFEHPNVLNAEELRQYKIQFFKDRKYAIGALGPKEIAERDRLINLGPQGKGTDWFDEITRSAPISQYNIGVNGGSDNVRYNVSLDYTDQKGTLINTGFKRYSIRTKLDADITDKIRFSVNLAPTQTQATGGRTDAGSGNFNIFSAVPLSRWTDPSAPVYNEDGTLTNVAKGDLIDFYNVNPLYLLKGRKDDRRTNQILAGTYVEVDLLKGLTAKTFGSVQYIDRRNTSFEPSDFPGNGALTPNLAGTRKASAGVGEFSNTNLTWENTLTYNTTLWKDHKIDALVGFTMEKRMGTSTNINANNLIDESIRIPSFGNTDPGNVNNFTGGAGYSANSLVSLIGRLNYSFKNRYYLTGTIRRDGSSRFGSNTRYGNFPSIGMAWRISNEKFFDGLKKVISDLKIKGGYGVSGSNANIGNYQAQGQISSGPDYVFGAALAPGSAVVTLPNSLLTWEEAKETNLGLNIGFLKDKIYFSANYYNIESSGFLSGLPLPSTSGFNSILTNLGSIRNKGLELDLKFNNILNSKDFHWDASFNFSTNKSKVLKLAAESGYIRPGTIARAFTETKVGKEVGLYRGFQVTGLFTKEDLNDPNVPKYPGAVEGSLKYKDGNGDGVLGDQEDFVIIGNPNPDFTYGMVQNFTYKDFDLRLIFAGSVGQQIFNGTNQYNGNQDGVFNLDQRQLARWRPGQDPTKKTIPGTASAASRQKFRLPNSLSVDNADYLWVKNITLGYNLKGKYIKNIFKNARIYSSIQNPFLFTAYKNGNPEINRSGDTALVRNVNYGAYPISTILTLGFNITF